MTDKCETCNLDEEAVRRHELDALKTDLGELKADVKELLIVWQQGRGAAKFLVFLVSVLAAGWTTIQWVKDHVKL